MISAVRVVLLQATLALLVAPGPAALAQTGPVRNDDGTLRAASAHELPVASGRVRALAPGSLTTLFTSGNSFAGNTFDRVMRAIDVEGVLGD